MAKITKIIKVVLAKWNGKLITVKNFVRIATHSESRLWSITKLTRKSKFYPYADFSTWALLRDERNAKEQGSSKNKDQLRALYNCLNQKLITTINTLDGSALGDNLITSHQVDYMSSVLIPAETVDNNQEHFVANKAGSTTLLV